MRHAVIFDVAATMSGTPECARNGQAVAECHRKGWFETLSPRQSRAEQNTSSLARFPGQCASHVFWRIVLSVCRAVRAKKVRKSLRHARLIMAHRQALPIDAFHTSFRIIRSGGLPEEWSDGGSPPLSARHAAALFRYITILPLFRTPICEQHQRHASCGRQQQSLYRTGYRMCGNTNNGVTCSFH